MPDQRIKTYFLGLGLMVSVLLLPAGFLHAQASLPTKTLSSSSLLDDGNLLAVSELASALSTNQGWLQPRILGQLTQRALRLDEIFADAPHFLLIEGRPYRLKIGPLDSRWQAMEPKHHSLIVFLTAEVYNRLGEGRLLAFQEGAQTVLWLSDLDILPTLSLHLQPSIEKPMAREVLVELGETISLGAIREDIPSDPRIRTSGRFTTDDGPSCYREVAPSDCRAGKPVCSDPNSDPWFILDSARKVTRQAEGQSPEIEFFPLQPISLVSGSGAWTDAGLPGRIAQDMTGRWLFLPDFTPWKARLETSEAKNDEWAKPNLETSNSFSCSSTNDFDRFFSQIYSSETTDWFFRGHITCLDPACLPRFPTTARVLPLKFSTYSWRASNPLPNLIPMIEGSPPGRTCPQEFGGNSICAEFTNDETLAVSQTCCILSHNEGTSNPNACIEPVNFIKEPDPEI